MPRLLPVDEVLGAIYRIDLKPAEWLKNLRAIDPLEETHGYAMCILRDARAEGGDGWIVESVEGDALGRKLLARSREIMRTTKKADLVPPNWMCGSQSESAGRYPLPEPWRTLYADTPTRDVWALFALSAEGNRIGLSHLLPRRAKTPPRARRFWGSASVHLSAAYRLLSALHRKDEAVLDPDGKLLHAEGIARDSVNREALRHAARALDKAKLKTTDPLAAIESCTAMVEGRWSLVDEYERDGRHFLVARVNEPDLAPKGQLSRRELHVAALAALGRSNKEIAYELGLQPTSIASYVGRLRKKLGVRRSALIR